MTAVAFSAYVRSLLSRHLQAFLPLLLRLWTPRSRHAIPSQVTPRPNANAALANNIRPPDTADPKLSVPRQHWILASPNITLVKGGLSDEDLLLQGEKPLVNGTHGLAKGDIGLVTRVNEQPRLLHHV